MYRFIETNGNNGAMNMALDEALLISASTHQELPALRLFSWDPPTLSLGYAQKSTDVNRIQLKENGWDLVRRPTGGRAILHTDELTYSIAAPIDDPVMAGSLLESYQRISRALLKALNILGIVARGDSTYSSTKSPGSVDPICFEVPSNYEITVNGKKLIGSAQARKNGGVLQHGSLPLNGDLTRITQVLNYSHEEKRKKAITGLLEHAGTIQSLTGKNISLEQAQQAFISAFSTELGLHIVKSEPSAKEIILTNDLVKNKYATEEWNFRS